MFKLFLKHYFPKKKYKNKRQHAQYECRTDIFMRCNHSEKCKVNRFTTLLPRPTIKS